ncbi:uncharacterized protein LOC132550409 [Ylistrum balloti]|uniref:uncharacterized protein LOC132550409 n=1 Tax=Ylistrum balloti TaxID=509963 RepID=UPI002905A78E|nr:uncharacterized protein LOC132550409 [Ylistrum balloti]
MTASTPICVEALHSKLQGHPDQQFVNKLIHGLTHGFDTGLQHLPINSIVCKNLRSAISDPGSVSELLEKELNKGYLIGPFDNIPYSRYRINPLCLAEHKYSKKKRLIVDLSTPHRDTNNPSLNSLIDKLTCSLKYVTVDDAIYIIKHCGLDAWLMKTDITDAFKLIPIDPFLWPYHGVKWNNKYYFFTCLVFGCRSSPKIFDSLSRAVCWIAKNKYNIRNILHLLDDFIVIEPAYVNASLTMERFMSMFKELGIPVGAHKTVGPCTSLEYLGVSLDSHLRECRLPREKVERIIEFLDSFKRKKSCTKCEMLSLLGHMNFACRCIRPGRSFVSHLISLSTTVRELYHHVKISNECRSDLYMWSFFLKNWNGRSFFLDDHITSAADLHLFTDATSESFGGIYLNQWFQGFFPSELKAMDTSMALFELYPIVMACVLWGHQWHNKHILFHCDNVATVDIISKVRSKVSSIMCLMRKLTYYSAMHNFVIHAVHIPGKQNNIADAISRFQMCKFRQLAPQADVLPVPCLPMASLMMS